MMRPLLLAMLAVVTAAAPAAASTLPTLDMERRHPWTATLGVTEAALDYAVAENLSVGALGSLFAGVLARGTWRLAGGPERPAVGLTLGGGYSFYDAFSPYGSSRHTLWLSPALVGSLPLGAGPQSRFWVTLRGALGPGLFLRPADNVTGLGIMPNLEVAFVWRDLGELTFLGNGLVGLRGRF